MRINGYLTAAVMLCAVLAPAAAEAQRPLEGVLRASGRGMLGVMTEAVRTAQPPARQVVITDVVPDSPAQRAGLVPGDTIVRINGLAATAQVMGSPFEPGDTVVLSIRRGGSERDVTLVAVPRPATASGALTEYMLADSVQRRMTGILRGVQAGLDTVALRGLVIERFAGDSNVVMRFGNDSVRVFRNAPGTPPDSLIVRFSSIHRDFAELLADSARMRVFTAPRELPTAFQLDTVHFLRPAEALAGVMSMGLRAVAGAELAELNPGLAEYFGVMNGVLVLDARDGTPAARAGIRAGDVIVRVNGTAVSSIAELRRTMAAVPQGTAVEVRVLRRGQPIDVTLGR
jgi:hypothetical protein